MKKNLFTLFCLLVLAMSAFAQARPKLVVGIVVDQMRWDYLMRYQSRYGEGGFKRLMKNGFNCENCQINYIPTITAIGHTSVYTGSVPSIHGIAGNNFWQDSAWVYCTGDKSVSSVGTDSDQGKMSPHRLLATTMTDELKLATNFRSKVIGVSLKDRAAILPAGHCADAAYWFDSKTGNFISSTYYMKDLPQWAKDFNNQKLCHKYLSEKWETLYPVETYVQSTADDAPYEYEYMKNMPNTFPYDVPKIYKETGPELIKSVPAGMKLTFDMAKAALEGENLGKHDDCDFLAVSISPSDYVGHQFGVNAVETEDTYLRLDLYLADFLKALDKQVGNGNYIVFLTADHAGAHNLSFLQDHGILGEPCDMSGITKALNKYLQEEYKVESKLILRNGNYQFFINHQAVADAGLNEKDVVKKSVEWLKRDNHFAYVADMEDLASSSIPQTIRERAVNGYNRLRSGAIQVILQPGSYGTGAKKNIKGTTHGCWNPYDAHIPCIFMGWNIPKGYTNREVHITDIAATICALLHVQMPSGCIGEPIEAIAK